MYNMIFRRFLQIMVVLIAATGAHAYAQEPQRPQPEISSGIYDRTVVSGKDYMIVTANPHASEAGYKILKKGGSATDAVIAAQLVLGLVEPQSSGLGGGAFALHYSAKDKKLRTYDARETAPSLAGPYLFYDQGRPMGYWDAVIGGRAVGVPGTPALLSAMHERHGKLTWMELFDDAIALAGQGFTVSPRLARQVTASQTRLAQNSAARDYLLPNGAPLRAGETLKNPAYQDTLKEFSFSNAAPFYHGDIAADIVETVQGIKANPGLLNLNDFKAYRVKERNPVCGPYRAYIVCSMGQPSSGALTLLQILGMLEHFDISQNNAQSWHIITQASALAFADRGAYIADPDFVNTPDLSLLDPQYLKSRAALIDVDKPIKVISSGTPPDWSGVLYGSSKDKARPGTSHISVIDSYGDIVSLTTTIEGAFGSHVMASGFFLNNELTDFSFVPTDKNGAQVANRVEGGKRPRSSMSPTIVFDQSGNPVLVIGSAGGSRIIGYVLQRIIGVLDWKMDIDDALSAPHILARGKTIEMEDSLYQNALESRDNNVDVKALNSGLTAIHIKENTYHGFADSRREGIAKGN